MAGSACKGARARRRRAGRRRPLWMVSWDQNSPRWPKNGKRKDAALNAAEWQRRSNLEASLEVSLVEPVLARFFKRVRAQARGAEFADDLPIVALFEVLEGEQLLGDDHVAFHADDLGDVGRPA